jgi:hypothetical protein
LNLHKLRLLYVAFRFLWSLPFFQSGNFVMYYHIIYLAYQLSTVPLIPPRLKPTSNLPDPSALCTAPRHSSIPSPPHFHAVYAHRILRQAHHSTHSIPQTDNAMSQQSTPITHTTRYSNKPKPHSKEPLRPAGIRRFFVRTHFRMYQYLVRDWEKGFGEDHCLF